MPVHLRPFEVSDYAPARSLWEATPGVGLSAADDLAPINAFLRRNPGTSFVAVDGDNLIGTVLCGHDGRRGLIHHLVTARSHRRQGIATLLLNQGLQALGDVGIDKCHLLVFRSNSEGLAFWRASAAQERVELALFSLGTTDAS